MNHYSKNQLMKKYRHFWNNAFFYNRSTERWIELMESRNYGEDLRFKTLPNALIKLQLEKKLTPEQAESIKNMIASPDKENWVIAILLLKRTKKHKF